MAHMGRKKTATKTVACYCRVASRGQKNDSQRSEIRRWLRGNGIKASRVHWFEDKETGASLRRPAFDALQQAIFHGTITTVVVWKLDRISRQGTVRETVCERLTVRQAFDNNSEAYNGNTQEKIGREQRTGNRS